MQTGSTDPSKPHARPRSRAKKVSGDTLHLNPKQGEEVRSEHFRQPRDEAPTDEMIATAAYFLAEHRHFEPGHELEDWLTAERQVRSLQS